MKHGVTKMKNTKILILTLSALSLGLSGCANVPPDAGQNPEDPYEAFNRNMHAFNVMVDDAALKPVTKGYRWVTPQFVQDGVSNAIDNLGEVNNTLNNVLQGKVDQGITSAFHDRRVRSLRRGDLGRHGKGSRRLRPDARRLGRA